MKAEARAPDRAAAQELQRRSWLRAGAGLGLIALLLGALALLEPAPERAARAEKKPAAAAPARPPTPAAAVAREPLIGAAVALPEPPPAADESAPQAAAVPDVPAEPPQSEVSSPAGADSAAGGDGAPPAPAGQAEAPEAVQQLPVEPVPAGKKGYLVQLGVFGVGANAEALLAELQRRGVPGRLETRVVAGPFGSRKNAEETGRRLQQAGFAQGLVVRER